jgi:hypothetical protein
MCLGGRARGKKGDSGWGERGFADQRTRGHEGRRTGGLEGTRAGGCEGWRARGPEDARTRRMEGTRAGGREDTRAGGPEGTRAGGPEGTRAGSRGYVPATRHPGMGSLGQHAVLPLPCEGFAFYGRDAAPLPNVSLANWPTGQPVNFVSPCPRVTLPTCPLRRLHLRFRLPNEGEDAECHRDEPGVAGPLGQAEKFR